MTSATTYTRPDGAVMVAIGPHQFVSEQAARRLGLIGRVA